MKPTQFRPGGRRVLRAATLLLLPVLSASEKVSAQTPTITIAPAGTPPVTEVREGTAASFTVSATQAPTAALTIRLFVAEDNSHNQDFVASGDEGSKMVTIAADTASATFSVPTTNDRDDESNGAVTVTVTGGAGYTVGSPSSATVAVNDYDPTYVFLTAPRRAIAESGSKSRLDVTFSLAQTLVAGQTVTVPLTVFNATVNTHYTLGLKSGATNTGVTFLTSTPHSAQNPALVFAGAGARTAVLELVAVDNTGKSSQSVRFSVDRGSARGAAGLGDGPMFLRGATSIAIIDDENTDAVSVSFSQNGYFNIGGSEADIVQPVTILSRAVIDDLTLEIDVTEGTAKRGSDFVFSGRARVPAGLLSQSFNINLVDDEVKEANETFTIAIDTDALPTGFVAGQFIMAKVTIVDDDEFYAAAEIRADPGVIEGRSASVVVSLSHPVPMSVTVPLRVEAIDPELTNDDFTWPGGRIGTDGSWTFAAGQQRAVLNLEALEDDQDEGRERLRLSIVTASLPEHITAASPSSRVMTLRDDDGWGSAADFGSQLIFDNDRAHKNYISIANTHEHRAVTVLTQYYSDALELVLWYLRVLPAGGNVLIDPYDHLIPGTDPPTNVGDVLVKRGPDDSGRFVIAVTAVAASVGVDADADGSISADEGNAEATANVLFPAFLVKDAVRGVDLHGVGNIDRCGVLTRTIPDSPGPDAPPSDNLAYTQNGNDGVFDCRTDDPRTAVDETDRTSRNVGDLNIKNARPIAFNHLTGHFTETLLPGDSWGGTPVIRPAVDDPVDYQVLHGADGPGGGRLAEVPGGGVEAEIVNTVSGYANRGGNFEEGTTPANDTSQGGKIRNTTEDSPRRQRGLNGGSLALTALYAGGAATEQIVRFLSVADEFGGAGKYRLVAAKTGYRVSLMDQDGDALPIPVADPPPVFGGLDGPAAPPSTKIIVDGIRVLVDAGDCEGTLIDGPWTLSALTSTVPTAVTGAQDFDGLDADVDPMRNTAPGWIAFRRTGLKCETDFGDGDSAVGSSIDVADGVPATDRRTFQAGTLVVEEKDASRTFVTTGRAVVWLVTPKGAFAASWSLTPLPAN